MRDYDEYCERTAVHYGILTCPVWVISPPEPLAANATDEDTNVLDATCAKAAWLANVLAKTAAIFFVVPRKQEKSRSKKINRSNLQDFPTSSGSFVCFRTHSYSLREMSWSKGGPDSQVWNGSTSMHFDVRRRDSLKATHDLR